MKDAANILTAFILGIAQFIIGVFILADKADIKTIGWYYVFASSFMVFVAILVALAKSISKGE